MTREEAIEFGNIWLQINEDLKGSSTYAFYQMAIRSFEAWDKVREEIEKSRNFYKVNFQGYSMSVAQECLEIIDKHLKGVTE